MARLNYAGKSDATFSADGAGTPADGAGAHDSPGSVPADAIVVSDAHLLFNADFKRSGVDLILSNDDRELVLHDYFEGEKRARLLCPDGTHLSGNIVNALTGRVEHAQTGGAPEAAKIIGHVQTAIGSGTLTRACGIVVEAKVGDPVCQGDVIETAADGRVGLRFIDGTAFNLSPGARMVLDEFVCDSNGASHSALFGVTRGSFDFIVGQVAKNGCLRIDTPVGSIRGRARTGGIGTLTLTALIFCILKEVQAAEFSSQRPLLDSLDDDKINPKDLQLNGVVELFMRDGRHYTLDDPSQTVVIRGSGSISAVTNSPERMEELQRFQQEALAAYALGTTTGPTSTGGGGSPQPFSTPGELQPINFQIDQPGPQDSRSPTTQLVFSSSASIDEPLVLLKPLPPPVLTLTVITPMVGDSTVNTANTLNASGASTGFAINGTTSGVENGRTVTVTIVNGSNVAVETFTATVTNNAWSVNVSPTQAHALSDGGYTVMASVSNAAGTPAPPAAQNLTVDETPPVVTFGTVSFTDTGVQGDHITSNGQVTLSGTVSDNVTVSQVQVFNGSQLLGTAIVDNIHHTWTLTTTLAQGAYNQFNATAIDEAGNPANAMTAQTVQVNDAPVLTPANPTLTAITEDQITNVGQTVSSLIGASISDVDAGAVKGIAITALTSTNGTWQYSIDGGTTWTAIVAANNAALLLDASDKIRFLPDGNNGGSDTITYRAWDETAGTHGTTADTSTNGGTTAFSTATDTAHLTVASVNDAPVLTPANPTLTAITEDQITNVSDPGQTVSSFIGASISDVDAGAVKGIAITALTSTNGTWQYSIDGGTTWTVIVAANNAALLLDASDKIRFLPDGNNGGSDTITYRAWDETAGTHGTTADTSTNGGTTAFSTATDTAHLTVASVNDAPVLTPANPTLTAITEDQITNVSDPGQTVSSFIGASISDVDAGAVKGIAITALTSTNGTWQYSIDGGTTWTVIVAANNAALLLDASDKIRFLPDGNNGGSDTITYRAWDETAGTHGTTADTSTNGGTTAFSTATDTAHLTVASVNDAPVLTPANPTLTAITEDQITNVSDPGQTVSSFIGASISDVDAGAVKGIAITALTSTNGTWQYSIDGGTTWTVIVAANNAALLLDASDKIRFLPDGNNGGSDTITYRAWDETAGTHGTTADTSTNGGTTAFSTATDTAHLTVASVNDAPVLTPANPTLTAITEDQITNVSDPGQTVSSFIGASISDVDAGAVKGIAITALTSTNGTWQYSIDGGTTWTVIVAANNAALLLDASDKIRFLPDGNNGGSDTITYRAWDETAGTHGTTADTSTNGGTTAFSTATDTAHLTVASVNDAPVLTPANPTLTAITEDQITNVSDPGQTVSSFIGASISDVDAGAVKGIAITALTSTNGTWQYSIDGGTTWTVIVAANNAALLLDASDKIRFLPDGNNGGSDTITYRAWDETAGTHGTTADTSTNGGTTAFSTATDTAHLTVASVNDAPVLTPVSPTLTAITEDQITNVSDPGQTVSSFIGASISDVDAGAVKGIAITALTSTNGTWQYSIDGGTTWTVIVAANNAALLLDASDKIRFLPDGNNGGSDTITYRAWDETAGTHGTTADTSTNGGTTAFSTATDTAHLTVASVNDAPVLTPANPTLTAITEDQITNVSDPGRRSRRSSARALATSTPGR